MQAMRIHVSETTKTYLERCAEFEYLLQENEAAQVTNTLPLLDSLVRHDSFFYENCSDKFSAFSKKLCFDRFMLICFFIFLQVN